MTDEQNDDMVAADMANHPADYGFDPEALEREAWELNDGVEEVRESFDDFLDEMEKRFDSFEKQYRAFDFGESEALFDEDGDESLERKARTLAYTLQEFSALTANLAGMVQDRIQELRDAFELDD